MAGLTVEDLTIRGGAKGSQWQREYGDHREFAITQVLEHLGVAPEAAAVMAVSLTEAGQDETFMNGVITAVVALEEKLGVQL